MHQYIGVLLACAESSASLHSRKSEFPSCMDIYRTKHGTGKLLEAAEKKKAAKGGETGEESASSPGERCVGMRRAGDMKHDAQAGGGR